MAEVNFGWFPTAPNPRSPMTGYDARQRGWRLHAVPVERGEDYMTYKRRPALCGLWPRHGWGGDLFIEDECARCCAAMTKREAGGDVFVDLPAVLAKEREAEQLASEEALEVSDRCCGRGNRETGCTDCPNTYGVPGTDGGRQQ